ncbi:hypothetical protein [Nocardia sp. NPDC056100]|uniref:hypothetical protein n=1 Tax=Nocardia sp. NPDC056100 TaxID=3345712 RepID=UPI0035D72B52
MTVIHKVWDMCADRDYEYRDGWVRFIKEALISAGENEIVSDDVDRLREQLAIVGYDLLYCLDSGLYLRQSNSQPYSYRWEKPVLIKTDNIRSLAEQLPLKPELLEDYFGFTLNSGYVEIEVLQADYAFDMLKDLDLDVSGGELECRHLDNPLPRVDESIGNDTKERFPGLRARDRNVIHVADSASGTCLELSPLSPCGVLFSSPINLDHYTFQSGDRYPRDLSYSLKVSFESELKREVLTAQAMRLAGSFFYELATRNDWAIELRSRINRNGWGSRIFSNSSKIRFPRTKISMEVSELFSFAENVKDNPLLAFTSYYQVLEYFFPFAARRAMIRDIRRELADPRFEATDESILRVARCAESGSRATESDQISLLMADSVRVDMLEEFLGSREYEHHFGKNGPIKGVEFLNKANAHKSLTAQVSARIYGIRNRIVHAKDDPKYSTVPVLLPRGREAAALGPDVALARFLAVEVITDAQVCS